MSKIIDNYVLQNTIGQGQYGKVYKAYNVNTNNVVAIKLLNAFQVLAKEKILHRDLKPSNILLHDGVVKIADFGFCKTLAGPMTMVGSPIYMAPEVLKGDPYSLQADVWSLGVCLFEMLFGKCPFEDHTIPRLMMQIQTKPVIIPSHIQKISEGTEWLLKRMLTVDPQRRIQWQQLFEIYEKGKEAQAAQNISKPPIKTPTTPLKPQRQNNHTPTKIREASRTPPHNSHQRSVSPDPRIKRQQSPSPIAVRERGRSPVSPWIGSSRSKASEQYLQKQYESVRTQASSGGSSIPSYRLQTNTESVNKPPPFLSNAELLPNKNSTGSSDTSNFTPSPILSPNETVRWNLRILLLKRRRIVEQLKVLSQILESADGSSVLPFLQAHYIRHGVIALEEEMQSPRQPESWDVMGNWTDFRNSSQFSQCQTLIAKDLQQLTCLFDVFHLELRRYSTFLKDPKTMQRVNILEFSKYPPEILRVTLLREGIRYLENVQSKVHLQQEAHTRKKMEQHLMSVISMLQEVGRWTHLPTPTDPMQIPQLIYSMKNLYINF